MKLLTRRKKKILRTVSSVLISCAVQNVLQTKRKPRRFAVRPLNRDRQKKSFYYINFLPMKRSDPEKFFAYTRMTVQSWNKLLQMVMELLSKSCTNSRHFITAEERLAVTIHYMAHGTTLMETALVYAMGHTTASVIVMETCDAIWSVLQPIYIPPLTDLDWNKIAHGFCKEWQLPNCVAAVDGKHVTVQAPWKSGSLNFNYKKLFSIHLLAACDAHLRFLYVYIGADGSLHDSNVFHESALAEMISSDTIWPEDKVLPNSNILFPHYFVGDAAFPLSRRLQRPYPGAAITTEQEIFNYRLSRARRTIENTFGVLAKRFTLLRKPIQGRKRNIRKIVGAMTCLHNFLMEEKAEYQHLPDVRYHSLGHATRFQQNSHNRSSKEVRKLRDSLCWYLNNVGAVDWQWDALNSKTSQKL